MRKNAIAIIFIIAFILSAQGCSNAGNAQSSSPQTATETAGEPAETTVTSSGTYGDLSVIIPESWNATVCTEGSDKMVYGLYGLILKPKDASKGQIELFCADTFGVCGTGLTQKEMTLAGYKAHMGTYHEGKYWDFVVFTNKKPQIVAQHTDCSSWTDDMWNNAMKILDTVKLE